MFYLAMLSSVIRVVALLQHKYNICLKIDATEKKKAYVKFQ